MVMCLNFSYKLTTTYIKKHSYEFVFMNNELMVLKSIKLLQNQIKQKLF